MLVHWVYGVLDGNNQPRLHWVDDGCQRILSSLDFAWLTRRCQRVFTNLDFNRSTKGVRCNQIVYMSLGRRGGV